MIVVFDAASSFPESPTSTRIFRIDSTIIEAAEPLSALTATYSKASCWKKTLTSQVKQIRGKARQFGYGFSFCVMLFMRLSAELEQMERMRFLRMIGNKNKKVHSKTEARDSPFSRSSRSDWRIFCDGKVHKII